VLGPANKDWRGLDPVSLPGQIEIDGQVRDRGRGGDLLGNPMQCLAWLAGSRLAAAFGGLRAGQVVMLGSVTPPVWLDRPARVTVRFPPLPPVSLQFI
jgi:2-keto-4-pentenoate hydratase